jgi:uncharacterized protein (DUF2141 family)
VNKRAKHVSAVLMALLLGCAVLPAWAARLIVEVTGLGSTEGAVVIEVFGSRVGFPKQPSYSQSVPIQGGFARAEFSDLGPSDYAVLAYHDRDGNGRQNRGFGAEPFGYSNLRAGERASWEDARISLGLEPVEVRIDLGPYRD